MLELLSTEFQFPEDHPCLAGHFPNDPIIPGVVLLETIRELLAGVRQDFIISGISQAKFHLPIRPGQRFNITLMEKKPDTIVFECQQQDQKLASGKLIIKQCL